LHLRSPQLDEILTILKQQAIGVATPYSHTTATAASLQPTAEPPVEPVEQPVEQTTEHPLPDLLANLDLEALAEAMQGPQGIKLQTPPDQASPSYFTGAAVLQWLQQNRDYTHAGAMLVGQWLLQKGLIYAIADDRDFDDSQALYQFYQDSPAAQAKSVESPSNPVISDQNDTEIYSPDFD